MTSGEPSNWQAWMREQSRFIAASFESSGRIEHRPTSGRVRERQILDTLQLLPRRLSIEQDVVVIDYEGRQSATFDGALVDRNNLPLLYEQGGTKVVMCESVGVCLEVKSNINQAEIVDIFDKVQRLSLLRPAVEQINLPLIGAFGYRCTNLNLAFFDYAVACWRDRESPACAICILNQGIFGTADEHGVFSAERGGEPVYFPTGEDSLLVHDHYECSG